MKLLGHVDITDRHDPYGKEIAMQRRKLLDPKQPRDIIYYAALCILDQQFAEAELWLDRCLELWPGNREALYHRSLIYLYNGDYPRGWPLYEHRFACYEDNFRGPPLPLWDGQPTDRPVLLWQEGGFGDVLMPARFLPLVAARCAAVRLFADPAILPLLDCSGLTKDLRFTEADATKVADGDAVQCSLMSLPYVLGISLDDLDGRPFLNVPESAVQFWRKKLVGQAKIGFCWSGNPQWERDATRSMPLDAARELTKLVHCMPVVQQATGAKDWVDTAAVLSNCDLVLSTCTSIAHCAAALGIPTWIMLSYDHDWRWGRSYATHSPWYNSARLFRQPRHGDWQAVIGAVYTALRAHGAQPLAVEDRNDQSGQPQHHRAAVA